MTAAYDADKAAAFCAEMSSSTKSIASICRLKGMPSKATIFRWKAERPDFALMYEAAKGAQIDSQFDEIVEIADNCGKDKADVQKARLRIWARIEAAQRLKPKQYGLKTAIGGAEGLPPVQTDAKVEVSAEEAYRRMIDGRS